MGLSSSKGIGYGQAYQDIKASRALGVTYYNTKSKPILVIASVFCSAGTNATFALNGASFVYQGIATSPISAAITLIVMPGASYAITGGSAINNWVEMS